jgi:hypothetical protein
MGRAAWKVRIDVEVGSQHRPLVVPTLEHHTCMAPDGAVGAVAADQIARSYQLCLPAVMSERHEDPGLIVAVGQQLGSPLYRQSPASQVRDQHRFDPRLAQDEQKRIGRIVEVETRERHRDLAVAEVQLHPGGLVAAIQQRLGDRDRPQHLEGAWLDDQGSGRTARYAASIDNPDRAAEGGQLGGEG